MATPTPATNAGAPLRYISDEKERLSYFNKRKSLIMKKVSPLFLFLSFLFFFSFSFSFPNSFLLFFFHS